MLVWSLALRMANLIRLPPFPSRDCRYLEPHTAVPAAYLVDVPVAEPPTLRKP